MPGLKLSHMSAVKDGISFSVFVQIRFLGGTYGQGTFCETFHSNDAGWRNCESCKKHVHCGSMVSNEAYLLLDAVGIDCRVCVRKSLVSKNQTNKNGNGFATPSHYTNTVTKVNQSIANTSIRPSKEDGPGSKASPGPSKRKANAPGSENKHLRIENEDPIELKIIWEEAQELLRRPANPASSVVIVDGLEIEEFQEAPVLGKPTFFSTDHTGEMCQWAQCENCLKWRKLPVDALLSFKWTCSDNTWDKERASCTLPQELSEEEFAALLLTNNDSVHEYVSHSLSTVKAKIAE
ncbi:hypothetical protein J5N97_016850 [Dioscorea zingiberensis]|uniref:CW-type domain-containing protein n=1 Tax=Dioscorea zingiberensis TaxID=325984 RepID=A0A9D5CKN5_9LILI|nr:hypothetical protein J5N97_016850 [Dioscorea zingiberensis]